MIRLALLFAGVYLLIFGLIVASLKILSIGINTEGAVAMIFISFSCACFSLLMKSYND
jgi:hypothetical protein